MLYQKVHTQSRLLQNQMTLNIIMEIKDRSRREENPSPKIKKCLKWRKNIVPLKWISLFLLAILPIFEVPNWCIKDKLYTKGFSKTQCDPENYPNSNFVKFPPAFTTFLTLIAYCLLSIFVVMRLFIKKKTTSAIIRSSIMILMMLISSVDLIWVWADNKRSTTAIVNILNVCLLLFFVRAIREVWI